MTALLNGVVVQDVAGRGRGVLAARTIKSGETVLSDLPIFIVCNDAERYCSNCLRDLFLPGKDAIKTCPACKRAAFCDGICSESAQRSPAAHTPDICRTLSRADFSGLGEEEALSLRLLIQAQGLLTASRAASPVQSAAQQQWQAFASLQSCSYVAASRGHLISAQHHQQRNHELCERLQRASSAAGVASMSLQDVEGITGREAINVYGIMAKSGPEGERRIRGTAVYPIASSMNHECLPNAARLDDFDSRSLTFPHNTAVEFRALHDLPAGEEITQSYFPLNVGYKQRQQRLQEAYQFTCTCPRCQEEATWSSDEEGAMGEEGAETHSDQEMDTGGSKADEAYIYTFLLKYVCPSDDCHGTLVPMHGADSYTCNMCGHQRTEQEFMTDLEQEE